MNDQLSNQLIPAKPPFRIAPNTERVVIDADGDWVLACDDKVPACGLWKDRAANDFCRACGRLWVRMEWATSEQCGIEVKP